MNQAESPRSQGATRASDVNARWITFWGDFVYPFPSGEPFIDTDRLRPAVGILNLEGPLLAANRRGEAKPLNPRKYNLFSTEAGLSHLTQLGIRLVSLGNNHITDFGGDVLADTLAALDKRGILHAGAGMTVEEAERAAVDDENRIVLLSAGWDLIDSISAGKGSPGVAPVRREALLRRLRTHRKARPDHLVVVSLHWGYERERIPQPGHRLFCRRLVDEGADVVYCHHAHRFQPIEFWKDKLILHGMGNFFLPQIEYFGLALSYPDWANDVFAVTIEREGRRILGVELRRFRMNNEARRVEWVGFEDAQDRLLGPEERYLGRFASERDLKHLPFDTGSPWSRAVVRAFFFYRRRIRAPLKRLEHATWKLLFDRSSR